MAFGAQSQGWEDNREWWGLWQAEHAHPAEGSIAVQAG